MREKHQSAVSCKRPDQELKRRPFALRDNTRPTELHWSRSAILVKAFKDGLQPKQEHRGTPELKFMCPGFWDIQRCCPWFLSSMRSLAFAPFGCCHLLAPRFTSTTACTHTHTHTHGYRPVLFVTRTVLGWGSGSTDWLHSSPTDTRTGWLLREGTRTW